MDIKQINSAIMFGNLTNTELDSIISAIKFARANLTRQAKRSFTAGSRVKFTSSRTGQTVAGTVTKVAVKYITVRDNYNMLWRVPGNMLEAA